MMPYSATARPWLNSFTSSQVVTEHERDFDVLVGPRRGVAAIAEDVVEKFVTEREFLIDGDFRARAKSIGEAVLAIESRQSEMKGKVRFDFAAGKILNGARAMNYYSI